MARRFLLGILILAALGLPLAAQTVVFKSGDGDLDGTLSSLNLQAKADLDSFTLQLAADFGVKRSQLEAWLKVEKLEPAEVYLVLEIGRIARKPPAAVIAEHRSNRGKGWGAVAAAMGIKPGSPEFKALKANAGERNRKIKAKKKK